MTKDIKSAVVVGAGIGGLCTASRLAKNGYQVTIFEKESKVGGRANRIEHNGYFFDTGPTLLMMVDVLYETFKYCQKNLDDYIELIQLEPNYQVYFHDKTKVVVSSNLPKMQAQLSQFGADVPEQFYRYFSDVAGIYSVARTSYIEKNFDKLSDFFSFKSSLNIAKKRGFSTLYGFVSRYFEDEHIRQLFSFQSMYLGVSPYESPAVYSIISYMETGLGIWYPKGGMYKLVMALEKLAIDMGVKIITNSSVDRIVIKDKKVTAVRLENGSISESDLVICNADIVYAYEKLLPDDLNLKSFGRSGSQLKQSSSALLFYWGVKDSLDNLLHHNVYLSKDFKNNLEEIFHKKVLPNDPSFYVYVPTKTDPSLAPDNYSILYCLIPVPNLDADNDWQNGIQKLRSKIISRLKSEFEIDLEKIIETEWMVSPHDFESKYNLTSGSAFGLTHHFMQSGYFRPHNVERALKGLYFVGASTYPGGGVPMVTLSAKLVVERILKDNIKK